MMRRTAVSRTAQPRDALDIPPGLRASIRHKLLGWYNRHARDLPWRRRQADPYAQWVAETMLQQTRVDTVRNYYERFMKRFPDARSLAEADHEEVLKYWEGLGYYRRILHLHRAVQALASNDYRIPSTARELQSLPGVGAYTAAAIASIGFGQRTAAVDGNVGRVLARLFHVDVDVLSTTGRKRITSLAEQLIPADRPGDFNQAWMDLGSSICTPQAPDCARCPLVSACLAAGRGLTAELPVRTPKAEVVAIHVLTALFVWNNRILVRRRPIGGLWSGLWEFPGAETSRASRIADTLARIGSDCGVALDGRGRKAAEVEHRLTHRLIRFRVYVAAARPGDLLSGDRHAGDRLSDNRLSDHRLPHDRPSTRWVDAEEFGRLSVSTAHRRVFSAAREALAGLRS